jgi:hypothetical protein
MSTLSRIKTVPAYQDAYAVHGASDTIPAPPPSSKRQIADEENAPQSRLVESTRRHDTLPAPPPDADDDEEPIPSTERAVNDAS